MKSKVIKIALTMTLVICSTALIGANANTTEKQNLITKQEQVNNVYLKSIKLSENKNIMGVSSESVKNEELEKAIKDNLEIDEYSAKQTKYYYNYVDLNNDDKEEIFVQLIGPYTSGSGGDTALIFRENNGKLEQVDKLTLVRNPIIISSEKTNGWNDIIVESYGGGTDKKYVKLQYDGTTYPNVNEGQTIENIESICGTGIIANDVIKDMENGKSLYLGK